VPITSRAAGDQLHPDGELVFERISGTASGEAERARAGARGEFAGQRRPHDRIPVNRDKY
jgi:hypothetical protein